MDRTMSTFAVPHTPVTRAPNVLAICTQCFSSGDRACAALDPEFPVNVPGMDLDRVQRKEELAGDFLIGQPFGDELKHFEFALAQRLDHLGFGTSQRR